MTIFIFVIICLLSTLDLYIMWPFISQGILSTIFTGAFAIIASFSLAFSNFQGFLCEIDWADDWTEESLNNDALLLSLLTFDVDSLSCCCSL